jgi:nucleotide-binding universal stress UspA family protein
MYKIGKILVPVDFSSCSRAALEHALAIAQTVSAKVDVLHVIEIPYFREEPQVTSSSGTASLGDYALAAAKAELDEFLGQLPADSRSKLTAYVAVGRPRDTILEHAGKGYDLIVAGTHGRTGRAHSFAGSLTESLVRSATCPVLTVREPD